MILYGDAIREYALPDYSGETLVSAIVNDGHKVERVDPCLYRNEQPIQCWTLTLAPGQTEELEWYRTPELQAGHYRFLDHEVRISVVTPPDWTEPQEDLGLRFRIDDISEVSGNHDTAYTLINATITLLTKGKEVLISGDHTYGSSSPETCADGSNEASFVEGASIGSTVTITSCQRQGSDDSEFGIAGRVNYRCSEFLSDNPGWVGSCPTIRGLARWVLP